MILISPAQESDMDFIISSWLSSYRGAAYHTPSPDISQVLAAAVDAKEYRKVMRPFVMSRLKVANVVIAHLADDRDIYAGWACGKESRLDYVYVKQAFRSDGLCTKLLGELGLNQWQRMNQTLKRLGIEDSTTTYQLLTWPWFDQWLRDRGFVHSPQLEGYDAKHKTTSRPRVRQETAAAKDVQG